MASNRHPERGKTVQRFPPKLGLKKTDADQCIYVSSDGADTRVLAFYVDDGLLCCSDKKKMDQIISNLKEELEITVGDPS